jgi:hypothetical protein
MAAILALFHRLRQLQQSLLLPERVWEDRSNRSNASIAFMDK